MKLMFWGCLSYQGVGRLHLVEGMMNQNQYLEVLQQLVLPQADQWFEGADWVFQQDLAPCHTAHSVQTFFKDHKIQVLKWPGNSPDLSPIENLWGILKERFGRLGVTTKNGAVQWMLHTVNNVPNLIEICENLVDSMPNRVFECIKSKGGHIRY
jgi:hypothetical protein